MRFRSVGTVMQEMNHSESDAYSRMLSDLPLRSVRAVMVERRGECEHADGETLEFAQPWAEPGAPVCPGLLRALRPFLAAAAAGIPPGQDGAYFVSCPGRKGTVWRVDA